MASDTTPETAPAVKPRLPVRHPGIYRITNTTNGKVYIGSSQNVTIRLSQHRRTLRLGTHFNMLLQGAFDRDGEAAFRFEEVERCALEDLIEREQAWIDRLRSADRTHGYNLCRIADSVGSVLKTEEHRVKISAANKGRKRSAEFCRLAKERGISKELRAKMNAVKIASPKAKAALKATNVAHRVLTKDDVCEIVRLRLDGISEDKLASRFGLTRRPIRAILAGETYAEITGIKLGAGVKIPRRTRKPRLRVAPEDRRPMGRPPGFSRPEKRTLTDAAVRGIRTASGNGISIAKLATAYSTSLCTVQRIIHRQTYRDVL